MAKLNIDIDVNGQAKVKQLDKAFKDVEFSSSRLDKQNRTTSTSIGIIAASSVAAAGTIYAIQRAFTETITAGFEFSRQMEESKAGLQALSLAIQDKNIPLTERMTTATKEASIVMAELQKINAKTPHTLDQTNQIYKAMYVSMKNVGASSQDIINLTQKLSVASGAAGIEFNSLLAGVDGLATGTVLANSDLGRFLGSLGLTNDALKGSTDVVKLLNETLQDFKAIDTITTATSNLKNEWGSLSESLTRDIFVGAKSGMNELSSLMKNISEEDTAKLRESMNGFAIAASTAVLGVAKAVVFLAEGFESLGARIAGAAFIIENGFILSDAESESLEKMYQKTKDNIKSREDFIIMLEKSIGTMNSAIISSEKSKKAIIDESEAYNILNKSLAQNIDSTGRVTDAELEKIYADELLELGLDAQGNKLEKVKKKLIESKEAYESTTRAVDSYTDSLNSATGAESRVGENEVTSYTIIRTAQEQFDYEQRYDPYASWVGFASGGYTGDTGTSDIAGVVHGQEYVVDSQTTKDLGLNGSGGVFESMNDKLGQLSQLSHLFEINKTLKQMLILDRNTYTLLEERLTV